MQIFFSIPGFRFHFSVTRDRAFRPAETRVLPAARLPFPENVSFFLDFRVEKSDKCVIMKTRKQAELAPNKNDYKGRKALMVTIDAGAHSFPLLPFFLD